MSGYRYDPEELFRKFSRGSPSTLPYEIFEETEPRWEGKLTKSLEGETTHESEKIDLEGKRYYSFCNIPYAKYERFKDPEEYQHFESAASTIEKNVTECEGTLFLNVYTPNLPKQGEATLLPVIVFIPGETYLKPYTHTAIYSPSYLMHNSAVIVVTVSYRQGIRGFLKLKDPALGVPGNAGLKDIIMSLLWIQKNIYLFRGDPNNVTVWGHGIGAACVHHLILNEQMRSKNIIKKIILQSGSALHSWGNNQLGIIEYCRRLDLKCDNLSTMLKYLQNLPLEELLKPEIEFSRKFKKNEQLLMAPSIDTYENLKFLDGFVSNLQDADPRKRLDIPVILGFNSHEGLLAKMIKVNLKHYLCNCNIENRDPDEELMRRYICRMFSQESNDKTTKGLYIMITELAFAYDMRKTAILFLATGYTKVFFYKFSQDTSFNVMKKFANITDRGACHADDLGYLFKTPLHSKTVSPTLLEKETVKFMVSTWQNFAKVGTPTTENSIIQWPELTKTKKFYLDYGRLPKILDNFYESGLIMHME